MNVTKVEFSLYAEVDNPEELRQAAAAYAVKTGDPCGNDYLDPEIHSLADCVHMLMDPGILPGCCILSAYAEGDGDD